MDLTKKRKMNEILRGLIGAGFVGGQAEIVTHLQSKGFDVTQSTVSRALSKMGAVKTKSQGSTMYTLPATRPPSQFSGHGISNLIVKVDHNENTIVVKTTPGSAMFVAGFIDHYCTKIALGTVAGDDTILVIPKSCKKIKNSVGELKEFLAKSI